MSDETPDGRVAISDTLEGRLLAEVPFDVNPFKVAWVTLGIAALQVHADHGDANPCTEICLALAQLDDQPLGYDEGRDALHFA